MDPFTIGTVGAGIVGGLLAKKKPRNPFRAEMDQQTQTLSGVAGQYGGMAKTAQNRYNTFRPQADAALGDYADYLKQDPFTDQVSTQVLGRATAGTNTAYDAAKSNLAASMARRGLSGDSSAQVGGDAAIETARAGDFSRAENDLALRRLDTRRSNLSTLTGLLGGQAENERGNAIDATGRQAGVSGSLLDYYAGQNREANADNDAAYGNTMSTISGLGSLAGGMAGGGGRAQNPFRTGTPPFTPEQDDPYADPYDPVQMAFEERMRKPRLGNPFANYSPMGGI